MVSLCTTCVWENFSSPFVFFFRSFFLLPPPNFFVCLSFCLQRHSLETPWSWSVSNSPVLFIHLGAWRPGNCLLFVTPFFSLRNLVTSGSSVWLVGSASMYSKNLTLTDWPGDGKGREDTWITLTHKPSRGWWNVEKKRNNSSGLSGAAACAVANRKKTWNKLLVRLLSAKLGSVLESGPGESGKRGHTSDEQSKVDQPMNGTELLRLTDGLVGKWWEYANQGKWEFNSGWFVFEE